jgi:hypothetical protein
VKLNPQIAANLVLHKFTRNTAMHETVPDWALVDPSLPIPAVK